MLLHGRSILIVNPLLQELPLRAGETDLVPDAELRSSG
jgi:hypothetical protein